MDDKVLGKVVRCGQEQQTNHDPHHQVLTNAIIFKEGALCWVTGI